VDRYARVNERLERAWGSATGWAPPPDKYKFTIEDLNRAGINLRDNVSRVTAKAQRHGYAPLTRLWEPKGLFHELALETGMMRRSDDGRVVVQAKLFHRAAALADEWFSGAIDFAPKADGSQRVVRKYGMVPGLAAKASTDDYDGDGGADTPKEEKGGGGAPRLAAKAAEPRSTPKARKQWTAAAGGDNNDGEDEEMLDVDGSAARTNGDKARHSGGRLRIGWDDDEQAPRRAEGASAAASGAVGASPASGAPAAGTATAKTRTPLPTNGARRTAAEAGARQPATKAWTSINRPAADAARTRSPGTLKRHRLDDDEADVGEGFGGGGSGTSRRDDTDASGLKRRQVRGPDRRNGGGVGGLNGSGTHSIPPRLEEILLKEDIDVEKLQWALDFVREAADVVVQRGGLSVGIDLDDCEDGAGQHGEREDNGGGGSGNGTGKEGAMDKSEVARVQACILLLSSRPQSTRTVDAAALAAATTMAAMTTTGVGGAGGAGGAVGGETALPAAVASSVAPLATEAGRGEGE
jgi:hypothetical protein